VNIVELQQALRALRLSGMAEVVEMRILQAQTENLSAIDLMSLLVNDEMVRRSDRFIARRLKAAQFRDVGKTLNAFDYEFNKNNKREIFELATCQFMNRREDALFLGPPGTGKSHLAQAIGLAAIQQGHRVLYRETHTLLDELRESGVEGTRKACIKRLTDPALLIIDDLGMKKLPNHAGEELLEVIMRRYEKASTILTSNRPVEDWGKVLGDNTAVTAMLDRMLHHGHVIKCGPRSYRTANRTAHLQDTAPLS
jgi:DNA replication protein DnaC